MEIVSAIGAIFGSVIGGIITGHYALKSVKEAFENQKEQSAEEDQKNVTSLLQGIYDELEIVLDGYQRELGPSLASLKEGEALMSYYPLVGDYFPVYNGNTLIIGRIQDNDLRRSIIRTYHLGRSMIDSIRLNNDLIAKYEYAHKLYEETGQELHHKQAVAHFSSLVSYGQTLKQGHIALMESCTTTLRSMNKNAVISEVRN
ncbi:hypothetical protein [Endozoicomonas sp. YOMI1]|uniref:hypothetical protein n=1 Tax=Endozoicomonas sp. YOMI1 TaxID=2828739 RepID=UPI002148F5AB|nr:hypothetical protein [Endozoicomonas sp. YOMI1]